MVRSVTLRVAVVLAVSVGACNSDSAQEIVDVSFDGRECTVAGTTDVPPGDYAFVLTDVSGREGVKLIASRLVDGHTYRDVLDREQEYGGPGSPYPKSSWDAPVLTDTDPPEIDLAANQRLLAVSVQPGNHYLSVEALDPPGSYGMWVCGPFNVVES